MSKATRWVAATRYSHGSLRNCLFNVVRLSGVVKGNPGGGRPWRRLYGSGTRVSNFLATSGYLEMNFNSSFTRGFCASTLAYLTISRTF